MAIVFNRVRHPRVEARKSAPPPSSADEDVGINGRIAIALTRAVGTMWCAYAFALLALVALPSALNGGMLALVQWLSQTFIQLVMLSVIMVGQNIITRSADRRSEMTWQDADAALHEAEQIQVHLQAQDQALDAILARVEHLQAELLAAQGRASAPS